MRVAILTGLLIISFSGFSQVGDFKKIIAKKNSVDRESYFNSLREFQKMNAQFSSVYYQLGNVELELFSNLDPITERVESRQRILNIKTNYSLAKNYLDPKELGRFPEWYDLPDLKDKDSLIVLGQRKVDAAYADTESYSVEYENLIFNYDQAVSHYLKTREGFIGINNRADNLRQLFLEADESLKQEVRQVGVNFDSCIYHLNIYRDTYQLLPHKEKRKVNVTLRRIDHFRMNGITPVNFLADEIDLWDYGSWSKRFLELLRVEVDGLQDEIISAYQQFETTNQQMMNGDDCLQAELDKLKFQRIINLISKYDNESVLADIFRYLIAKLRYGNQYVYERNCNVYGATLTDDLISRKARVYQSLFDRLNLADSLNEVISNSGDSEVTFMWFFDRMMGGKNGSMRFAENQKKENTASFKNEIEQLTNRIDGQLLQGDSTLSCYELMDDMLVLSTDTTSERICFQKALALNDTLSLLISHQEEQSLLVGGVFTEFDYQKQWEIKVTSGKDLGYFKIVGDSSFVIGGTATKGWLNYYSFSGKQVSSIKLPKSDTIVNVSLNQLLGNFQVIQVSDGNYTISDFNFSGKTTNALNVSIDGSYVGSFANDQSTMIFSINRDGVLQATEVDAAGAIINQYSYAFASEIKEPLIIKNDNQKITMIAKSNFSDNELIYALLNYNGEVEHEKVF